MKKAILLFACMFLIVSATAQLGYSNPDRPKLTAADISAQDLINRINYTNIQVNMSTFWGNYYVNDYNMPVIKSFGYNQSKALEDIFGKYWINQTEPAIDYSNLNFYNKSSNIDATGYNVTASSFLGFLNWSWLQNVPPYVTSGVANATYALNNSLNNYYSVNIANDTFVRLSNINLTYAQNNSLKNYYTTTSANNTFVRLSTINNTYVRLDRINLTYAQNNSLKSYVTSAGANITYAFNNSLNNYYTIDSADATFAKYLWESNMDGGSFNLTNVDQINSANVTTTGTISTTGGGLSVYGTSLLSGVVYMGYLTDYWTNGNYPYYDTALQYTGNITANSFITPDNNCYYLGGVISSPRGKICEASNYITIESLGNGIGLSTADGYDVQTSKGLFVVGNISTQADGSFAMGISDCYDSAGDGQVCSKGGVVYSITDDASDVFLKSNLTKLSLNISKFNKLNTSQWIWNDNYPNKEGKTGYGFIAQDVQSIYPELTRTGKIVTSNKTTEILTINYAGMIALQYDKIKELETRINNLEDDNNLLKKAVCKLDPMAEVCK